MSDELVVKQDIQKQSQELTERIQNANDINELKREANIFNAHQIKIEASRINKLNTLLDKSIDLAVDRVEKCPDELSNKEVIDIMTATRTQLDKSTSKLDMINETPMIQVNQQNVNINVDNENTLNRESREKVLDFIQQFMKQAQSQTTEEVIDVEVNDTKEDIND